MVNLTRNLIIGLSAAAMVVGCSSESSPAGDAASAQTSSINYLEIVSFGEENGTVYIGNPDAEVEFVEYASLTCSHCAEFHNTVMPRIKQDYIATGKVRFVFQEFPTEPIQIALAGFALARCSGESGYLGTLDDFFANQASIFDAGRTGNIQQALVELGERNGTKEADFEACITSQEHRRAVAASVTYGQSIGVGSTPSLFLNGEALTGGDSRTPDGLARLIDNVLAGNPAIAPAVSTVPTASTPPAETSSEAGSGS